MAPTNSLENGQCRIFENFTNVSCALFQNPLTWATRLDRSMTPMCSRTSSKCLRRPPEPWSSAYPSRPYCLREKEPSAPPLSLNKVLLLMYTKIVLMLFNGEIITLYLKNKNRRRGILQKCQSVIHHKPHSYYLSSQSGESTSTLLFHYNKHKIHKQLISNTEITIRPMILFLVSIK